MESQRQRQFRIHQCLGRGGFGEVYRATMLTPGGLQTDVALKVLRVDVDPGAGAVRRLRDEGRMLSSVRHPAILRAHDLAVLEGRVALVTEYVAGQDLAEVIASEGSIPARPLVQTIGVVADALDAAWNHMSEDGRPMRLIHRDIKPSNIRLGRHGEVKLLDFGIARSDEVDREARTGTGSTVGSIAYMAPERYSRAPADRASDVYALGCTLYEGLAGRRLFVDAVPVEMFRLASSEEAHQAHVDAALAELPDDVGDEVVALLRDLLVHAPADRPEAGQVAGRCEQLGERLSGPTLRSWARSRGWPSPGLVRGYFDGRTITEGTLRTTGGFDERFPTDERTADATYQFDLDTHQPTGSLSAELPERSPARRRGALVVAGGGVVAALLLLAGVVFTVGPPGAPPEPPPPPAPVAVAAPAPAPVDRLPTTAPVEPIEVAPTPEPVEPPPEPAPVVKPAPVVRPAPPPVAKPLPAPVAKPDPAPVVAPEPAPVPEPSPPAVVRKGSVVIKGSPERVLLISETDVVEPGPSVAPGTYDVYVAFEPGSEPVKVNVVQVLPGQKVTLTCNPFRYTCE